MTPVLSLVIPCYNEERVLPVTGGMFLAKLRSLMARKSKPAESET